MMRSAGEGGAFTSDMSPFARLGRTNNGRRRGRSLVGACERKVTRPCLGISCLHSRTGAGGCRPRSSGDGNYRRKQIGCLLVKRPKSPTRLKYTLFLSCSRHITIDSSRGHWHSGSRRSTDRETGSPTPSPSPYSAARPSAGTRRPVHPPPRAASMPSTLNVMRIPLALKS